MGKAVFFNLPGAVGHINPSLGIVAELISRGEEVIYYADEKSRQKIEALGATFRGYQPFFEYDHPTEIASDLVALGSKLFELTESCVLGLLQQMQEDKPDYIIYDTCAPWGQLLAMRLNVPGVRFVTHVLVTPTVLKSVKHWFSFKLFRMVGKSTRLSSVISIIPEIIGARRRIADIVTGLGMEYPGIFPLLKQLLDDKEQLTIAVTSPLYQPEAEKLGDNVKFVGASVPEKRDNDSLDIHRQPGQPLIYVSLGSVHNMCTDFYVNCIRAFGDRPYQVIMSIGDRTDIKQLGPIPENFTVKARVPQLDVLQTADAFVSHGGMNSINESLYYNVPLVMVPQQVEQAFSALRISRLGAGVMLMPNMATPERLRQSVDEILSKPDYRESSKELGASLKIGGYQRAADEILYHMYGGNSTTSATKVA
ncbi:MAG: macrolide family glycosyltransferase [Pseudomonadota bacterium]|nr:macrolide family glycosyltransferase [Pseudomonadota bacterium]